MFPKYIQQDAALQSLFISVNCSTCFVWFLHPSSGAQNCTYSIRYLSNCNEQSLKITNNVYVGVLKHGKLVFNLPCFNSLTYTLLVIFKLCPLQFDKYLMLYVQFCAPDDGWRNHPKHVEQFTEINKLCNVASFGYTLESFTMHGSLNVKFTVLTTLFQFSSSNTCKCSLWTLIKVFVLEDEFPKEYYIWIWKQQDWEADQEIDGKMRWERMDE